MDSNGLRIILLVAGIALIIGIYGWDKIKRWLADFKRREGGKAGKQRGMRLKPGRKAKDPVYDLAEEDVAEDSRREPSVDAWREADTDIDVSEPREPRLGEAASSDEAPQAGDLTEPAAQRAGQMSAPSLPEVLVVNVVARVGATLSGDAVMAAARDGELVPGPMDIFHRYVGDGDEVLLSMANMVKPGTFPFAEMSDFSTPGLALFAQLPGPLPPLETYEVLLDTAERLSAMLDARIQDERHRPLTHQARDRMRTRLGAAVE